MENSSKQISGLSLSFPRRCATRALSKTKSSRRVPLCFLLLRVKRGSRSMYVRLSQLTSTVWVKMILTDSRTIFCCFLGNDFDQKWKRNIKKTFLHKFLRNAGRKWCFLRLWCPTDLIRHCGIYLTNISMDVGLMRGENGTFLRGRN